MEAVFLCNEIANIPRIYDLRVRKKIDIFQDVITEENIGEYKDKLKDAKYAFSTWGMLKLSEEKIKEYLPKLEAVFYAAGTVGYFAEPYLRCGIRVFSAAYANGIPVAEYTVSQILLATKGYFQAAYLYRNDLDLSRERASNVQGNYYASVGLIGLGVIGSMVAEKLKDYDVTVYAFDPFISAEKAASLGVELVSLPELFGKCDVISNHLANKEELNDILNYDLFRLMKKNATFINTGRGAQVSEEGLTKALEEEKARTAVLDVQKFENTPMDGPLYWCPNAIMTPHIAGSTGYEVTRMADYIIDQYKHFIANEKCNGEVTLEKLKTMA